MNSDIRSHFPLLQRVHNGKPLIYFDNAATTHKPRQVLDALMNFYTHHNAPVHRGVYALAEHATHLYEQARSEVARFINAADASEIVFTRGTTESINCVALAWAIHQLQEGDEIVITHLEHHANILPWQDIAQRTKAILRCMPVQSDGTISRAVIDEYITTKTKLVSFSPISNALGTHLDTAYIIQVAHSHGAKVMLDAAQMVPHQRLDVQQLKADFIAFSGHKMLAPTGIGVLYIAKNLHDHIIPYYRGGGMVARVDCTQASWLPMPQRLEAGTPAIAQAVGLSAAIRYLQEWIDFQELRKHEAALCAQLIDGLLQHQRITVLGNVEQLTSKGHLVSFIIEGIHAHDVAAYLDNDGICVRAGHHCAQPIAQQLGLDSSVRASFCAYNTTQEVESMLSSLKRLLS